jgi:hypothetical protein
MTIPRDPLSIDAALAKIAGKVPGSWKAMAVRVRRTERTVRTWGNVNEDGDISIPAAIELDLLYQEHGGEGAPIRDVYDDLLGLATRRTFFDQFEVLRRLAAIAKENGEAEAALAAAALPNATPRIRNEAVREVLEAIEKLESALPLLKGDPAPEQHNRGPPRL